MKRTPLFLLRLVLLAATLGAPLMSSGQGALTLANPNWNITLTDFGYSDFLLDNTPGFEGREYLSGEWGAAVAYTTGGTASPPRWLEPQFVFPDWATNSNFTVVSPISQTGLNADGLPIAQSIISNSQVQITLRFEMLDTVTGTPMGTKAASATGAATFLKSNRYVMKQTATIKNISGASITGLQFFQLLHGLSSQRGVFDNRAHAGALSEYRHDTTLAGIDPWSASINTSASGLEDYIALHAINAPGAHEVGAYGIEGNGVDAHGIGKPSDGVHLSIENNWSTAPYSTRQGRDFFQPAQRWVSGAQRWDLGSLAANQSASVDLLLSILTGTRVDTGAGSTGGCNGGSSVPGGLAYEFAEVDSSGSCYGSFSRAEDAEIEIRVARGEFDHLDFPTPGKPAQLWEVEFDGSYTGAVNLTFGYDETLLPAGFDEGTLVLFHFTGGAWQLLDSMVDSTANIISVSSDTLGYFALGVDGAMTNYTIIASALPANSGTVTGDGTFPSGAAVTLSATPQPGYVFVNWTDGGAAAGASPTLTFNASANRAFVANFVPLGASKAVTTFSMPVNGGSTSGGGAYALNSSATVSATEAPGFKFSKWLVNGASVSTAKNYTFTVTGDVSLTAKFKPVYVVNVTVAPAIGGEVEVDAAYEMGELAKLKAVPASGYCFVNFTQNGVPLSGDPNFSFNVTGNRDLVANFALGHRIDAAAEPKNAGDVTGAGPYPHGDTVTLTAAANFGYVFTNWTELQGQNVIVLADTPELAFSSTANRVLQANFIALPQVVPERTLAGDAMIFSWPAGATGWVLQESPDLGDASWTNSTRPVTVVNGKNQVSVPVSSGGCFFRLVHP